MEKYILVDQELDNGTDNFDRLLIVRTEINQMIGDSKLLTTLYKNEYILCLKILTISFSVDPTSVFEHL